MTESPVHRASWAAPAIRSLAAVALLVTVTACGSDGPTNPPESDGSITATVDGQPWSSTIAVANYASEGFASVGGNSGTTGNVTNLTIAFPASVGTHVIPDATGMNMNFSILQPSQLWQALAMGTQLGGVGTGTVTVTTLNAERVVGTFSFVAPAATSSGATGNKTVTNGSFNVKF